MILSDLGLESLDAPAISIQLLMSPAGPKRTSDAAATTSALTGRADLIPGRADVLRLVTKPVLETGHRPVPDAHNPRASPARITVSKSVSIWRTTCKGYWTAQ